MARTPKPWRRKARKSWYVTIKGERHNLGSEAKRRATIITEKQFEQVLANGRCQAFRDPLILSNDCYCITAIGVANAPATPTSARWRRQESSAP